MSFSFSKASNTEQIFEFPIALRKLSLNNSKFNQIICLSCNNWNRWGQQHTFYCSGDSIELLVASKLETFLLLCREVKKRFFTTIDNSCQIKNKFFMVFYMYIEIIFIMRWCKNNFSRTSTYLESNEYSRINFYQGNWLLQKRAERQLIDMNPLASQLFR